MVLRLDFEVVAEVIKEPLSPGKVVPSDLSFVNLAAVD